MSVSRNRDRAIEVDLHLALLTLLGSDDDDTIGSTATIDRSRCSILEHLNALDVITIEFVHTRLGWHTINNIKRIIVVQRTDTTNTYGGSSRRRTVSCNIHTRNAALKSLDRVVLVLLGYLINADYRDGTCQVGLALSGITSNNYLVEQLGIFFENDAQTLGSLHHLSLIPHKRDRKF